MKITVGCKLPHGTVLEVGVNPDGTPGLKYQSAVLNGLSKAPARAKWGTTSVDSSLWTAWLKKNAKFRYVVDGSIFVVA